MKMKLAILTANLGDFDCPQDPVIQKPPEEISADVKKVLGKYFDGAKYPNDKIQLFRGHGCEECGQTGYIGRVGIFEILIVTEEFR